ncbi:hypothetical protein Y88_1693 [Novosphingobium nitrogenifigens DSM 19370]|uniref:Uncharacterized protein n=1 Tax=Novosphingobium nitrogenifigens DSM 19370 TaxID=983920 RepID=F1Z3J1_9SPHN|nr:hypothetical protein Y88_1693 [Novosphingobium nitrogenifigens DSM 19370]
MVVPDKTRAARRATRARTFAVKIVGEGAPSLHVHRGWRACRGVTLSGLRVIVLCHGRFLEPGLCGDCRR